MNWMSRNKIRKSKHNYFKESFYKQFRKRNNLFFIHYFLAELDNRQCSIDSSNRFCSFASFTNICASSSEKCEISLVAKIQLLPIFLQNSIKLLNFSLLICQKCIFVHLFLILWKNLWKTLCDIGIKMVENGAVKIPNRNLQSYKYRLTFIVKVTKHKNEKNLKELSIKNPTLFTLLWIVLLCNVNICRGCHL